MTAGDLDPARRAAAGEAVDGASRLRDIADVPAVEIITTAAVHLMSAAAVAVGLADGVAGPPDGGGSDGGGSEGAPDDAPHGYTDLAEARTLITALAGLITAAGPDLGPVHARSLRDGLRSLQLAFREASVVPDAPGAGPGETWTGPVLPTRVEHLSRPPSEPGPA